MPKIWYRLPRGCVLTCSATATVRRQSFWKLGPALTCWRGVAYRGRSQNSLELARMIAPATAFSDPPLGPSDADNAVENLRRLIESTPIRTPIGLVGHSLGGEYATLFAATHKADVAGMVLIEPTFANQEGILTASLPAAKQNVILLRYRSVINEEKVCVRAAMKKRRGERANFPTYCLDDPPDPNLALHRELDRQGMRVTPNLTVLSENAENTPKTLEEESVDSKELGAVRIDFGDMPLIVLTADNVLFPGLSRAEQARPYAAWLAAHEALAKASTRGISIVVKNTSHSIQIDQPAAVINAVHEVVEQVRREVIPARGMKNVRVSSPSSG